MRANSPLRPAEDAVLIDSTDMPLEEVVERAAALVEARIRFRGSAEQGITER
jgi:CMP/dCMP kinase